MTKQLAVVLFLAQSSAGFAQVELTEHSVQPLPAIGEPAFLPVAPYNQGPLDRYDALEYSYDDGAKHDFYKSTLLLPNLTALADHLLYLGHDIGGINNHVSYKPRLNAKHLDALVKTADKIARKHGNVKAMYLHDRTVFTPGTLGDPAKKEPQDQEREAGVVLHAPDENGNYPVEWIPYMQYIVDEVEPLLEDPKNKTAVLEANQKLMDFYLGRSQFPAAPIPAEMRNGKAPGAGLFFKTLRYHASVPDGFWVDLPSRVPKTKDSQILLAKLNIAAETLEFYASVESYLGIGFFNIKKRSDFSEVHDELYGDSVRFGKRAREALAGLAASQDVFDPTQRSVAKPAPKDVEKELRKQLTVLTRAVRFYADPSSYSFQIAPDEPAGDFKNDFTSRGEARGFGKKARQGLAKLERHR